jgi:hypothetical protein
MVLELLLHPERAARIEQQSSVVKGALSFRELADRLYAATFGRAEGPGLQGPVGRAVNLAALRQLMALAGEREEAFEALRLWKSRLAQAPASSHKRFALAQIERFEKDPKQVSLPKVPEAPPGMPIGLLTDDLDCGWLH